MNLRVGPSTQPFMRCTNPKCGRVAATWGSANEAYYCPDCNMDESGLEVINPQDLLGSWWISDRRQRLQLVEWYGTNTFRAKDEHDLYRTISILNLRPVGAPQT